MTAGLLVRNRQACSGMRLVDPKRDMAAVAALVETAFLGRLDASGLQMLQWMKKLGRLGWLGWLIGWLTLPTAARAGGYVWEEDGKLVGNASILPVEGHRTRWVLVNVAVQPEYQRQGIAHSMVRACCDYVREQRAVELWLQVDRDNAGAIQLYAAQGFEIASTRTIWVGRTAGAAGLNTSKGAGRIRTGAAWLEQWRLAEEVYPEGLLWPFPLSERTFRPVAFPPDIGLGLRRHWSWEEEDGMVATLIANRETDVRGWRLHLIVRSSWQGKVEDALIARAFRDIGTLGEKCVLEYPADVAVEALRSLGFTPRRTLTWMRLAWSVS